MCSAGHLIVLYNCVKFHENISDDFRIKERTQMMEALMDRWTDEQTDGLTDRHSKFGWYNIIPSPLCVAGHKNVCV